MAYLNLDDNFADHPKVDRLSHGAFRLHVAGMCYAAKHLTNGHIPGDRVPRLISCYRPVMLADLLAENLWTVAADGYEIHDYLDWNKSRAWWLEKRERTAKRQAEWRANREA